MLPRWLWKANIGRFGAGFFDLKQPEYPEVLGSVAQHSSRFSEIRPKLTAGSGDIVSFAESDGGDVPGGCDELAKTLNAIEFRTAEFRILNLVERDEVKFARQSTH